MTDMLW